MQFRCNPSHQTTPTKTCLPSIRRRAVTKHRQQTKFFVPESLFSPTTLSLDSSLLNYDKHVSSSFILKFLEVVPAPRVNCGELRHGPNVYAVSFESITSHISCCPVDSGHRLSRIESFSLSDFQTFDFKVAWGGFSEE